MKKLLLALFVVGLVLPMAAYAEPPQDVQGYFVYTPNEDCTIRWAGDNEIWRNCTDWGDYYDGDFLGDSTEVYDVILHGSQGGYVFESAWYKGTVTLDGTVLGRAGTMEILFIGFSEGDIFCLDRHVAHRRRDGRAGEYPRARELGELRGPRLPGCTLLGPSPLRPLGR
jgi:hypothetical protein